MEKFKNKYRIPSARASFWDYRWAGTYFITICNKGRLHYFGKIVNEKMILSNIGVLADVFWHEIKNHAQNVDLGAFVVMPNHIHGILILRDDRDDHVETLHATSTPTPVPTAKKRTNGQYFAQIGYHFDHYPFLQICRYPACPSVRIRICVANPFSRPHYS